MGASDSFPEIDEILIADLKNYGPSAEGWLFNFGNFDYAVAYTMVFWPKFVVIDGYVLRYGSTRSSFLDFLKAADGNYLAAQAVMNHMHISDIHYKKTNTDEDVNEAQIRYLGRTLQCIHQAKLSMDFPGRNFVVKFNDEPGLDLLHYELTFWELPSSVSS